MNLLITLFSFLVAIAILIFVHEFGHYFFARLYNVKILRFSVGFGKPIFKWISGKDKTEYVIAAIPLGGYVKMLGETPADLKNEDPKRAFRNISIGKRTAIVIAGPLANFILAVLIYWALFVSGIPGVLPVIDKVIPDSLADRAGFRNGDLILSIAAHPTPTWHETRFMLLEHVISGDVAHIEVKRVDGKNEIIHFSAPIDNIDPRHLFDHLGIIQKQPPRPALLGEVVPNSPASSAGLLSGDKILEVDGMRINDWHSFAQFIKSNPSKTSKIVVGRGPDNSTIEIMLNIGSLSIGNIEYGQLGAGPAYYDISTSEIYATVQYSSGLAFFQAIHKTKTMITMTLDMMWHMVKGNVSIHNLSGPITVAVFAGDTAKDGLIAFFGFIALVSVSIGVVNLLPIPLLDGGLLLFHIIEFIKRSPVSDNIQFQFQKVGALMILAMVCVALYADLSRIMS